MTSDAVKRASTAYAQRTQDAGLIRKSLWVKEQTYIKIDRLSNEMSAHTGKPKPECVAKILELSMSAYMSADMSADKKDMSADKKDMSADMSADDRTQSAKGQKKWLISMVKYAESLRNDGVKPVGIHDELATKYAHNELPGRKNMARWINETLPKLLEGLSNV